MTKKRLADVEKTGLPLYEMQTLFQAARPLEDVKVSYITLLPGKRVPEQGTGAHAEDEYSFFLEGEVYTESGEFQGVCGPGDATLIPRGEAHWCENRTDRPCRILCLMAK
ncbi:MAG: cupin domain-containing protein [Clostridiales bacterium]|nr:cupin domain-containing protein [Clostridiales bacterium]